MKAWVGKSVVAIGVAQCLFGVVVLGDLLLPAVREGLFDTIGVSSPPERNMAYWFLLLGVMTLMLGGLMDRMERAGVGTPGFLPWGFLGLAVVGCVMSPASGFWLLWVPTVGLFLRRRSARAT